MYARSLSRLALVFVVLYLLLVISSAIPLRLLDYEWINRVTATLINGSSMPLLALLVLALGSQLYPENELLNQRRQLFSRLAGVAVFGFLLLIPLNIFSGLLQQTNSSDQVRALDASERQLNSYRQAANQATSVPDLQARMAKLSAPPINPELSGRPLPEVKAQMGAALNQVAAQIAQQRQALTAESSWTNRAPEVLRIVIACLVLAFGFAAFAQTTPTSALLIDSLEEMFLRLRYNLRSHEDLASDPFDEDESQQPVGWQRWFEKRIPPPGNIRNRKRSSDQEDHDYIMEILSEDSKDP